MPVTIGGKPKSTFADPIGLLTACHRRIERLSLNRPELLAVLDKVDSLEIDHALAEQHHAEVDRLGQAWLASGSLTPADAERFSELIQSLGELYRSHIAVEEREVFPAAATVLDRSDRAAMGGEMAARRGAHPTP